MKKPIEHHWYGGRRFDIWESCAPSFPYTFYVFSIDNATIATGTLDYCKKARTRKIAKALREEAFRRRKARRAK